MMNKIIFAIGVIGTFLLVNGMVLELITSLNESLTNFDIMTLIGFNLLSLSMVMHFYEEELK